jgi:protein-S-isoprenylcysteine O-methyltransferase Ste14
MIALLIMWQLHYFHRAFIYPFQLKLRPGSSTPIRMTLSGAFFCSLTGFTNGAFISTYADHLQSNDWFYSPAFIIGSTLFIAGYILNKMSDKELMRLRQENPDSYSVPHRGAYRWVSCPNYLGELITWVGFACAAWSPAGLAFAFMSASNLVFRALENHQWYKSTFPEYPPQRKALIPYVL